MWAESRKGFHVVVFDVARRLVAKPCRIGNADELHGLCEEMQPTVIAIDAPGGWSTAKSRRAERELARAGIRSFCTPSRERAAQVLNFYGWMFNGEAAYAAAAQVCPHFDGGADVAGCTMEVFPNATAHRLRGPQPKGVSKVRWRRASVARGRSR
ncbi:MAG: DUF429 domain-containing protein [Candidatus Synoicihabitans palmerolidicus]|nr:DUF429 domain-containing protein [Candidatus Synoicihabitans palmerolidicus]